VPLVAHDAVPMHTPQPKDSPSQAKLDDTMELLAQYHAARAAHDLIKAPQAGAPTQQPLGLGVVVQPCQDMQTSCPRLVASGVSCMMDLHALIPRASLPAGTLLSYLCPKTCETCDEGLLPPQGIMSRHVTQESLQAKAYAPAKAYTQESMQAKAYATAKAYTYTRVSDNSPAYTGVEARMAATFGPELSCLPPARTATGVNDSSYVGQLSCSVVTAPPPSRRGLDRVALVVVGELKASMEPAVMDSAFHLTTPLRRDFGDDGVDV
jgi:hypothetical protein